MNRRYLWSSLVGVAALTASSLSLPPAASSALAVAPLPSTERDSAAVTSASTGRTDLFWRGSNGRLVQAYRPSGGSWTRNIDLGGGLASQPAAVSWAPGRLDVFVRGNDNALWHKWYASGAWSGWESLGGVLSSAPAAASWGSGRLDVFVRGSGGALNHKRFSSGAWSAWTSLGGSLTSSPAATSWGSGRIDVLARVSGDRTNHRSYAGGTWSAWQTIGGVSSSQPAIASPASGQLDAVVRGGTAGGFWLKRFANGAWETSWQPLDGVFASGPGAHAVGDDVRVVGRSPNSYVYESVRPSPSGTWSTWLAADAYRAFRRLGSWVDTLDYDLDPAASVQAMKARDVRTLYLSTARFNSASDFFDETEAGQWLDAAHAAGLSVVGWYVPAYGDMGRDLRRTLAIATYTSPGGQRFDAVGIDIERFGSDGEVTHEQFNTRLVTHLQQVRSRTPAVIGAIVPSPYATDPGSRWTGFPWASVGQNSDVVVPMALWSFRSGFTPEQVYAWVLDQSRRASTLTGRRVHVEGGVLGEGSTPVTVDRMRRFVDAVVDGPAIGGSNYDYRTTLPEFWPVLADLNAL